MTPNTAMDKARHAAEAWGGLTVEPRLINNRENAVFEAHFKDGSHGALRLHRMGYQTTASIEAELHWTERLRKIEFKCPTPIRTLTGQQIYELPDGQVASVVSWIEAKPIGDNDLIFDGTIKDHCKLYNSIGQLIAQLHTATEQVETTGLQRPSWESEALLGETPHWGRFWENPSLLPDERNLLLSARTMASDHLAKLNPSIGLIHADLLQENILQNKDGLWLIDFDDGGYGYRGFDLGTALIQHSDLPYIDALTDATIKGYESISRAQPELAEAMPLYIMLRGMAACGWIISRAKPDDPRHRIYAERALRCVQRYLQTTTSMSS